MYKDSFSGHFQPQDTGNNLPLQQKITSQTMLNPYTEYCLAIKKKKNNIPLFIQRWENVQNMIVSTEKPVCRRVYIDDLHLCRK